MKRHGLIRFITAGSVDDGKSTLIGRLLYDSKLVLTDQLHNLVNAKSSRAPENEIDFSFLTDGLESEREQGITIDVAYRCLLYTSPSPRDQRGSRMPSSA